MKLLARFDAWAVSGPFTTRDVGLFRIVFTLLLIPYLPRLQELGSYPEGLLHPPPGPFLLLDAFPPEPVLILMEAAIALALAATLFGLFTRTSSVLLTVFLLVGWGFVFSLGKTDHLAIMMVVPAIMSFAGWGDSFSLDALRRGRAAPAAADSATTASSVSLVSATPQRQWPLRLLALALGVAFVTAATPKISNGWLNPATQASYGYQVRQNYTASMPGVFSETLIGVPSPLLWEPIDWISVFLELAVIVCVLSWTSWRIVLALLTLFHLGIALSLGIFFIGNLLTYGAWVSWGSVPWPRGRLSPRAAAALARLGPAAVILLGTIIWVTGDLFWSVRSNLSVVVIVAGAALGAAYLVGLLISLVRRIAATRTADRAKVAS